MKRIKRVWLILIIITGLFVNCSKSDTDREDVHNHSLLTKSLSQLRVEIAGRWQVKRLNYVICPSLPPCFEVDSIYGNNDGDLITFLNNDTIKLTGSNGLPIGFYEKANVTKIKYSNAGDSVYVYRINTGSHQYLMQEIKNDSLVINDRQVFYYLTRKP